ncbi:hypothetical protein MA5S0921_0911 [Mycobacteroides abscessus 5S-0921]|uniref:hypothetical protein n=1 Tax=Mycobacteroides abscessus TaxID=36809 RepID=UPI0002683A22|nr:hypothetical protein [Mycobacteroides abscessus]EIU17585.1 hypothetical protein MA5S0421_0435 [Mycobacteroides abscessus 5S-0421]EIU34792.1 hypothetical protein MA5S0817_0211 [Mycobacteroides abscessus 5S-0817]EIU98893.1 hypothetical protein MA5S0921_0911 [Mycobacteroides abscessus 5S-0921]
MPAAVTQRTEGHHRCAPYHRGQPLGYLLDLLDRYQPCCSRCLHGHARHHVTSSADIVPSCHRLRRTSCFCC